MRRVLILTCLAIVAFSRFAFAASWVQLGTWSTYLFLDTVPMDWRIDTQSIRREGSVLSYTVELTFVGPVYVSYSADCARRVIVAVYYWDADDQEWRRSEDDEDQSNWLWDVEPAHAEICRRFR